MVIKAEDFKLLLSYELITNLVGTFCDLMRKLNDFVGDRNVMKELEPYIAGGHSLRIAIVDVVHGRLVTLDAHSAIENQLDAPDFFLLYTRRKVFSE